MVSFVIHFPDIYFSGIAFQPEFMKPLTDVKVPLGRDAVFTCHVEHLGGYRVSFHYVGKFLSTNFEKF